MTAHEPPETLHQPPIVPRRLPGPVYLFGGLAAIFCLWVSYNAMLQTHQVVPGETPEEVLRSLFLGRPGVSTCSEAIHARYQAQGPDGKMYPTWHPPIDHDSGCAFDHEHGSDPHSYVGFQSSGMPLFGYTSARAGIRETHQGFKVFVANDDLHGHAWMITLQQDTGDPGRMMTQFHTTDWHISTLAGEPLVDVHVMADFGFAIQNCSGGEPIPGTEQEQRYKDSKHPRRIIITTNCAADLFFEGWDGMVTVGEVFKAKPYFEVRNPISAIDLQNPERFYPTCQFRPIDQSCAVSGNHWSGTIRSVMHPGQWVHNEGPEFFPTDPTGLPVGKNDPRAIWQFVARQSWDTRSPNEEEVIFRIQSYSGGVYIANPREPLDSAIFGLGFGD